MRIVLGLAAAVLLSSCSLFHREPPLPRRAVVEPGGSEEKFARVIEEADIIYFPSEAARIASRSDPAWKLLGALRVSGNSFAIGWDWNAGERDKREYLNEVGKAGAQTLALTESNQIVADRIAAYFREHGGDRLLLFLRRERLGLGEGVPYLVSQQTKARQLILNPRRSGAGPRLLARHGAWRQRLNVARCFDVVDRTPVAAGD